MYKYLLFVFLLNIGFSQSFYLKKIGVGSDHYFKVDKIYPNPMSNPSNIFTNLNLPDTLTLELNICNSNADTVFNKTYNNLIPGEYQFSWSFDNIVEKVEKANYILKISAFEKSAKKNRYDCQLVFLLLNLKNSK
ncbi:MAG TPA: hypothetical protein VLH59_10245 [Ignavibacteriaceae bacterium]|nr:hypothetical protein [Ignavibacteriaceae bacterium]